MVVNIKLKCINQSVNLELDQIVEILPELKRHLDVKEIGLKKHLLYYLKNKSNFKNIRWSVDELQKELDNINLIEREGWVKPPLEAIKKEKKIDKDSWRNYKWLP